ncbi:MAG: putative glycoside hydrolase [Holosporales bacterium]|jgi:hypothetical protein|nr:putative glycoside hydrolase [Holosporales bacterium]
MKIADFVRLNPLSSLCRKANVFIGTFSPQCSIPIYKNEITVTHAILVETPKEDSAPPAKVVDHGVIRGIYVGASNNILEVLQLVTKFECNAVVIDVKNEFGEITCHLNLPSGYKENIRIVNIKELLKILRQKGIYTIARLVAFRDDHAVRAFPELAVKNKDGSVLCDKEKASWLNPYNKKTWDYVIKVAKAAAEIGFDEIQFDYVRFSPYKNPNVDFGPISKTVSRSEIINQFIDFAVQELRPLGVKISIDVFGCIIPETLREDTIVSSYRLGQDWNHIVETVDCICPMVYPSHWPPKSLGIKYPDCSPGEIVKKVMKYAVSAVKRNPKARASIRPWLQAFTASWLPKESSQRYKFQQIKEQIQASSEAGVKQWTFWNPAANYKPFND